MKNVKKRKFEKDNSWKMVIIYDIAFIIVGILICYLGPVVFNFPPNSINNEFEVAMTGGFTWKVKAMIITLLNVLFVNINYILRVEKIRKYFKEEKASIESFREYLFKFDKLVSVVSAIAIVIITLLVMFFTGANTVLAVKTVLISLVLALLSPLISSHLLLPVRNEVLTKIKNFEKVKNKKNIGIKKQIIIDLSMIAMSIGIIFIFIGDFVITESTSNVMFKNYDVQLSLIQDLDFENIDEAKDVLSKIEKNKKEDTLFIVSENDVVYKDNDAEISEFFLKYLYNNNTNRTYDDYGIHTEGAYRFCEIDGQTYAIGIMYSTMVVKIINILIISSIMIILLSVFLIYLHATNTTKNIVIAAKALTNIANGNDVNYDKKMIVLENNEYGDIAIAYNKILDMEKEHNEEMKKNQEFLMEQERLASLGQLIGSLAHNLKTPIMSISGACEGLTNLTKEYVDSVGNSQVTVEDHHEIAKDMDEWIDKIKNYVQYMSEVINTAKGQAVYLNASEVVNFTIKEMIMRINVLMKDQLLYRGCELKLELLASEDTTIDGEISSMVQIIDNLIINAMDAYGAKGGQIILRIHESDKQIFIEVEDMAGGIPEKIKDKLFNQMITTKGKGGTGLGLYMCNMTIKGKFKGKMTFSSKEGKGTTFYITLNK